MRSACKEICAALYKHEMPTQKECHICGERIGVASKTCQYCHAKQPYKQKLETRKKHLSHEWKTRQKKNSSVNKVYDASNLLLHKWEVLERYPALLLARRTSNGFTAECLCPWQMDTEEAKDAFDTIKSIYENLLNGDDKKSVSMGVDPETSASNSEETSDTQTSSLDHQDLSSNIKPDPTSDSVSSSSLITECPVHHEASSFPYKKILRERIREGHEEVLVQWHPCSGCGAEWKNTWEPKENIL
ncbi:uncharacterized protein [Paramisgurnus dabryanus]|uniref:uncharacterized protein isoform X1 n=1 Tax=Paramisgurnus dabryanus TaxID=90735 RepID=UPI0031F35549